VGWWGNRNDVEGSGSIVPCSGWMMNAWRRLNEWRSGPSFIGNVRWRLMTGDELAITWNIVDGAEEYRRERLIRVSDNRGIPLDERKAKDVRGITISARRIT